MPGHGTKYTRIIDSVAVDVSIERDESSCLSGVALRNGVTPP